MKQSVLCVLLVSSLALAQDPTPTPTSTATATATPSACATVQACVDTGLVSLVAACAAANPDCTDTNTSKLAVSAGQIARRAIDNKKCTQRQVKVTCNACYQAAKAPLQTRYKQEVFKGLLAQAVKLIDAERKIVCADLPKNKNRK